MNLYRIPPYGIGIIAQNGEVVKMAYWFVRRRTLRKICGVARILLGLFSVKRSQVFGDDKEVSITQALEWEAVVL